MKNAMIQSLIDKENEIIKSYKNYLTNMPIQEVDNNVQNSIERHNNHIASLKNMIWR